uniref:Uncharacterized protein n=1 Tax=Setaria viridis TaxID=4556 RepID=A0A4U6TP88_SETVI|nr:hypothetical protein SEVIR_7G108050v2 [Setaria viridis]
MAFSSARLAASPYQSSDSSLSAAATDFTFTASCSARPLNGDGGRQAWGWRRIHGGSYHTLGGRRLHRERHQPFM